MKEISQPDLEDYILKEREWQEQNHANQKLVDEILALQEQLKFKMREYEGAIEAKKRQYQEALQANEKLLDELVEMQKKLEIWR